MRVISDELLAALAHRPLIAKITLDGVDIIQGDPVQEIRFRDGTNGDINAVSIGGTVAASVEVILDKTLVNTTVSGREMHIELGMELDPGEEWFDMGTYTVTDDEHDDGVLTVTGMDRMAQQFDVEYVPLEGFDFDSEEGVRAKAFVTALCARKGVAADLSDLQDHILKNFSPVGCTERRLLGYIAALYGKFAKIDQDGVLRFRWYKNVDVIKSGDDYYQDGMTKAGYDFSVQWLKCYNEVLEETLTEGDPDGEQGIYFACPWMTPEILLSIWESLRGFSCAPVPELTFFGDPRLEAGDSIRLVTLDGEIFRVPIMTIIQEFDGGLRTSVSSVGQNKSDVYEGPVQRETKRSIAKILKRADSIEMSVESAENEISYLQLQAQGIEARVKDSEGNISSLQQQADSLDARVEDVAGNVADLQIQGDEIKAQVEGYGEELTQVKQTSGQVSVTAADENGTLETKINPNEWSAERRDKEGTVTSGFRFDFGVGQFVFDGTGKFTAPDGKSYITVEGGQFVLYAKDGEYGDYIDIARIGFCEDSEGVDYPYFLLGHADAAGADHGKIGLLKMFSNGIWLGNSVPRESVGNFIGLPGAAGLFVNTQEPRTYIVDGEVLADAFECVFA